MGQDLLTRDAIRLGLPAVDRETAVREAGELLLELGAVEPEYVTAMAEREQALSSYVGEGFAIPHGTDAARALVKRPALVFLQFPDGLDWNGERVSACIGIAAKENEHVEVMSTLAKVLLDAEQAEQLRTTDDPDTVLRLLAPQAAD